MIAPDSVGLGVDMLDHVVHTRDMSEREPRVRITRSARKHGVGDAHIRAALANAGTPEIDGDALLFTGTDDRGVELEMVVVPDDRYEGQWAVIHAMPTHYRR